MITPAYLTLKDIAARTGRTPAAIRQLHKRSTANRAADAPSPADLPAPTIRIAGTPAWEPDALADWFTSNATKEPQP